jgi:DNA helicase HerA-like ATPase
MHVFLGTLERDKSQAVELSAAARMRHFAVLGKSGVGKTTLLRNMVVSDLCSGIGLTVLDPHGGLVSDLLSLIPRHRANDVIYINPALRERSVGINILESVRPEERHLVVQSVISIVKHAWPDSWGRAASMCSSMP